MSDGIDNYYGQENCNTPHEEADALKSSLEFFTARTHEGEKKDAYDSVVKHYVHWRLLERRWIATDKKKTDVDEFLRDLGMSDELATQVRKDGEEMLVQALSRGFGNGRAGISRYVDERVQRIAKYVLAPTGPIRMGG